MPLDENQAVEQARKLLAFRNAERSTLDDIYNYVRGKQAHPIVPKGVPDEVKRMARMSRVNIIRLVLDVPAQSLFVSGYRHADAEADDAAWRAWQANKFDARQTGVHRAALAYGVSYVRVTPGDPVPVIRGVSPRNMTAVYGDDDEDWPVYALEQMKASRGQPRHWRLYDDEAVYTFSQAATDNTISASEVDFKLEDVSEHRLGVCPVVRFRNVEDLDDDHVSEVEPLMPLQDQIDFTTFDLLVAQHFGAFRQRYILGWLAPSEEEKLKASASRLWTFDDGDGAMKVGEFSQTDLTGFLESREASLQHLATVSQTPPHHLLGKLVNLSAEALVAAESGQRRKVGERETCFGESHEQVLGLVGVAEGRPVDDLAQVRWRDTEARSLSQTVDALGKLSKMLGVPPQELWERVPGVTQQDVEKWRAAAAEGDVLARLEAEMNSQMGDAA